jgi:hypothetical protein
LDRIRNRKALEMKSKGERPTGGHKTRYFNQILGHSKKMKDT